MLEKGLDRNLRVTLARTAGHVRADADFLEALASEHSHAIVEAGDAEIRLDAEALAALPEPIASRVVRQALRLAAAAFGGEWEPDTTAAHIAGVLRLTGGRARRRIDLPGDLVAERRKEYVRLSRPSPETERGGSGDGNEHRRTKRSAGGR
jgi:tRNA(Ile)-lysidine synthase